MKGEMYGKKSPDKGAGVESGLSEKGSFADAPPKACGMDTVGPDQKPQAQPNDKVGKFRFK